MKKNRALKIAGLVILGLMTAAGLGLLLGWAVMALWNWLMPSIFDLPEISYWQAVGLLLLFHILFGEHAANINPKGQKKAHLKTERST